MKRIITILASLALIFSITACTNEQKQNVIENSSAINSEEKTSSNLSTKTNAQHIIFPANYNEKTEYNASIYEIEPFTLTVDFPDGWTVKEQQATKSSLSYLYSGVWSVMDIY